MYEKEAFGYAKKEVNEAYGKGFYHGKGKRIYKKII